MAEFAEFQIPSAIITAALIEKSELTGKELELYAITVHRMLIREMIASRDKMEAALKAK